MIDFRLTLGGPQRTYLSHSCDEACFIIRDTKGTFIRYDRDVTLTEDTFGENFLSDLFFSVYYSKKEEQGLLWSGLVWSGLFLLSCHRNWGYLLVCFSSGECPMVYPA